MTPWKFKVGAATFRVWFSNSRDGLGTGWGRAAGVHFDFWALKLVFLRVSVLKLRDSDLWPTCHAGYRVDDRQANPNLPGWA